MTTAAHQTMTIANRLAELSSQQKNMEAIDELYHHDIVSVEAHEMPGMGREMRGIEAIKGKNQWWEENNELHKRTIQGPFPHGDDRFALLISYDVTPKAGPGAGQRATFTEVGHYTVRDNKIAREEYFYAPQDCDA